MTEPQWIASLERSVTWTCSMCGAPIPPDEPMEYRPIRGGELPSRHDKEEKFPPSVVVRHAEGTSCGGWFVAAFPQVGA